MTRFRRNPRVHAELEATPEMLRALAVQAESPRELAERFAKQAGAPWMPRKGTADTIVIDVTPTGVRIVNTDHAGHLMEWGGKNNPPHASLRRAISAAGLRFHKK